MLEAACAGASKKGEWKWIRWRIGRLVSMFLTTACVAADRLFCYSSDPSWRVRASHRGR